MLTDKLNLSRGGSSRVYFIVSLVDMMLKLCLIIVKSSNPESLLGRVAQGLWALRAWELLTPCLKSSKGTTGHRVVAVNQNPSQKF